MAYSEIEHLTPGQKKLWRLLVKAASYQECADALGVSVSAVSTMALLLYARMRVTSQVELIRQNYEKIEEPTKEGKT